MSLKYGEIIKQMSLEEKALMMSGKNTWETVDLRSTESHPWQCPTDLTG